MKHHYVILTDSSHELAETKAVMSLFPHLLCVGTAANLSDGLDLILEKQPELVILDIEPENRESGLSLFVISELYRFLNQIPKIIVTAKSADMAFQAIGYGVFDYWVTPFRSFEVRKSLLRLEKEADLKVLSNPIVVPVTQEIEIEKDPVSGVESDSMTSEDASIIVPQNIVEVREIQVVHSEQPKPLILCVKSYGDYRFIEADQIQYLQADNNSTDIHLVNGEMVTAFKTLKHFEGILPKPFVRIHNSYIVNADLISRIHMGNSTCYLKGTGHKLPFSKSYKEKIDAILDEIAGGNYLEV